MRTIHVTEDDILAAVPGDLKQSAICLALMGAGCDWAMMPPVGAEYVLAGYQGRTRLIQLPQEAKDFAYRERTNGPRKPFTFEAPFAPPRPT